MGALHEGHLELVRRAKSESDRVVVSIFVNPTQFGPNEDFAQYPRTLAEDLAKLSGLEVDAVFSPTANEIYPGNFQTWISNDALSSDLCGRSRPGHFRGVCTVVAKLFNIVQPNFAFFGKKDYQQFKIIERMVSDLNFPVSAIGCEIVREPDGLAMSSRNRRLEPGERKVAPSLWQGLTAARDLAKSRQATAEAVVERFHSVIGSVDQIAPEYAEVRSAKDLEPLTGVLKKPAVLLVAAKLGSVRLIDNIELGV
jgi:pantoate--beta-alanine ligase